MGVRLPRRHHHGLRLRPWNILGQPFFGRLERARRRWPRTPSPTPTSTPMQTPTPLPPEEVKVKFEKNDDSAEIEVKARVDDGELRINVSTDDD